MTNCPLTVENIHKSYHDRPVLEAVSLALMPGEMFGLIGLNGAGKTTLIKIILDLVRPQQGRVTLFGRDATEIETRRQLSYLPEKFQPSRYLKGMEYLALCLSYYGRKLDAAQAGSHAERLDLDPQALTRRVSSYSKGMGQKLGLLGAFLADTPLLILDEPMSGLDPKARIRLKQMLIEARGQGKTVFFSSHILSDIDEICGRIGVIHEGRLSFTGTPSAFKAQHGGASLEQSFLESIEGRAATLKTAAG